MNISVDGLLNIHYRIYDIKNRGSTMSSWIKIEDGLPEKYEDVFLLLKDGTRCIGRMNHHGSWLKASYQKCRWQYAVDKESVVAWCKAPE